MLPAMSSSNHHIPPAVKRSFPSNDIAFPSGYPLSFVAVVDFARKVQQALEKTLLPDSAKRININQKASVSDATCTVLDDPELTFLFLPRVSPHRLSYRFSVAGDSVFVVLRTSYHLLKEALLVLNVKQYSGMFLCGPVGVGKSYLLYMLTAELRVLRSTYRVTYINDCHHSRPDKLHYFLRELVMTFFDDGEIAGKTLTEWCCIVVQSQKEENLMKELIQALVNQLQTMGLQWIIIFDQHNGLFNPSVVKEFPLNIINILSRKPNIKVIISASENNEGYSTEMTGWFTHEISSHKFDDIEFATWCKHFPLKSGEVIDSGSDEAVDAVFWTGGIPYELYLLWNQPAASLADKTVEYRKNRTVEMRAAHSKFCRKLSTTRSIKNLEEECISHMILGLDGPAFLVGMDRELLNIIRNPNKKEDNPGEFDSLIVAINPVARHSLIGYHGQKLLTYLGTVTEFVLEGDYSQGVKDQAVKKYLLTTMEVSKSFTLWHSKDLLSTETPQHKSIHLADIIHFAGSKCPASVNFNRKYSALFIPNHEKYPGFDFFIWDSESLKLLAFQVTVAKPFFKHPKFDCTAARKDCREWKKLCGAKTVVVYWIIPKICLGEYDSEALGDNVVLFEWLFSEYSALDALRIP